MKLAIGRKAIYYGLGGGLVFVLGALAWRFFAPVPPPVQIAPHQFVNVSSLERGVEDCATYIRTGEGPYAYLCIKDNRDLVVRWDGFPRDTATTITIYRAPEGSDTLEAWRTITVTGTQGESVLQSNLPPEEWGVGGSLGTTAFFIEATSPTGTIIFSSATSTATSTPTSTTPTATSTATSTPTSTTPVLTPPPPPPAATSTATSTPTSTTPTATSTPTSTTPVYYYSPGSPTQDPSVIAEPSRNFWVRHVNDKIEVGWYSLPPESTKAIISRSDSPDGPWKRLLTQEQPVTTYYTFYLVDSTTDRTHYYLLDAYENTEKVATYGPVGLPPLTQ